MDDAPAAELPNGNVLLALAPAVTGNFSGPNFSSFTYLYEYNAASNSFVAESTVSTIPSGLTSALLGGLVFNNRTHFLDLPNGHVLFTLGANSSVWDYAPDTSVAPASRPTVTSVASNGDGSFTLTGTRLTGMSEGAAYGDDAEMSTNFPIVKLTNVTDGTVWYANSFNWTPGVADSASRTVQFAQPYNLPSGTYSVSVIASGISSDSGSNPINIWAIAHLYADTRWQGLSTFTSITDADPVTPGNQPGLIGISCFASVNTAITHALTGATVTVNGDNGSGNFAEAVSVNKQIYLNLQGGPVSFNSLSGQSNAHVILSGATLTLPGATLTLTDNTDTTFAGTITNIGGLNKPGTGTFTLSGTETGSGVTTVSAGVLLVSGSISGSGGVTVSGQGLVRPTVATALAGTTVTVGVTGGLDLSALSAATVGGLAGTGGIGLDGKTLTVGADNADTNYGGVFTGNGTVVKAGYGTTTVSGLNNNPAMGVTVNAGALTATGTFTGNNSYVITVPAGGTFDGISPTAGSDSVNATVNVSGTFGAGTADAPGQLGVASLSMAPSNATPGTFAARLNGTTPGTQYDQVDVFLASNIGGATLNLIPEGFNEFASGITFTLIQAQNTAINGTFAGLPDQSVVSANGNYFRIGYNNGSAVTLTTIDAPVATDQNGRALIQVNDGSAQRSEVRSISVTYSTVVAFVGDPGNAFELKHVQGGAFLNNLHGVTSLNGAGHTVVTLTFTTFENAPTEVDPVSGGHGFSPSLADGRYQLSTGTYTSPTDTSGGGATQLGLFRLFGDATGNGIVDETDLGQFRSTYHTGTGNPAYLAYLDADNSGFVDDADLAQFNLRFNKNIFGP